jgi:putative membrane protein
MISKVVATVKNSKGPETPKEAVQLYFKGMAMGVADLIPGVSGGTIAFIVGIYEDLLQAVSSVNKETFDTFKEKGFFAALETIHIKFGMVLLAGIMTSMLLLARVMHYLITEQPIVTWSFFFGLICASIPLIWKQIPKGQNHIRAIFLIVGTVFAYLVVGMIPVTTPDAPWFIALCGVIGITAMILPGISGSFLLLMMGKYEMITAALKNPTNSANIQTLILFAIGTATGLLAFSRVLKYFLEKFRIQTMTFLTGVLIGSLRKVWPWKEVLETKVIRGKTRILREANVLPAQIDNEVIFAFILFIVGIALIVVLDVKTREKEA